MPDTATKDNCNVETVQSSSSSLKCPKRLAALEYLESTASIMFLRFVWTDISNVIRCKAVRTKWLLENKDSFNFVNITNACMALKCYNDGIVPEALPSKEFGEVFLVPDWSTFHVLPYEPSSAAVYGAFYAPSNPEPLIPWNLCPRQTLIRAIQSLQGGMTVKGAFEEEFYLIPKPTENQLKLLSETIPTSTTPAPTDPYTWSSCYSLTEHSPVLLEIVRQLEAQNVPIEQVLSESGPGQFEITVPYTDIVEACDRHITVRQTVRAVASKYGYIASFLPKVYRHVAGSGCHVHLSLWSPSGTNLVPDASDATGISVLAKQAIAGILTHAKGLTPIFNACDNSYERLQPNAWSGGFIAWGLDNKETIVRVPGSPFVRQKGNSNFEVKTIDHSSNPYLAMAATIFSMADGINNKLTPPPPTSVNPATLSTKERKEMAIDLLPNNLIAAVDNLNKNKYLLSTMGKDLCNAFSQIKMTISNESKFTEFLACARNSMNRQGAANAFNWYHAKYVKTGSFAVIVHAMMGVTLFSYIVRHERIAHHKTAPYH
eukprot:gene6577-7633_t